MNLLRDFQLPANPGRIVESESEARAAARELGYPVVLKTAVRGIDHKSDRDGVRLDIETMPPSAPPIGTWRTRIGPRVLVAPMIDARGVEMLLGMIHDAQFGPVVVLGFGGVHVEALADVVYALPPFDAAEARRTRGAAATRAAAAQPAPQAPAGGGRVLRDRRALLGAGRGPRRSARARWT